MIDAFDLAQEALATLGWSVTFVVLRVGAMMAVLPAFGEASVPARIKLALTLAFTVIVLPVAGPLIDLPALTPAATAAALGAEVCTGLFLGLVLRLFTMALQIAGTIAAQSTSLSQIFGGSAGVDPMPAMGNVLVIGGLALACISGLHVAVASYMINSYAMIPPGVFPTPAALTGAGVDEITRAFSLAFTLAAPFVVASLLYNITLGVINRAMPQLMVAFVGAPAITAGGLALLALTAPLILMIWRDRFFDTLASPFGPLP